MIELLDRWDDFNGEMFIELLVGKNRAVCIKARPDFTWFVLECDDGREVYDARYGADFPIDNLTYEEVVEVSEFVKEQFEAEAALNQRFITSEEKW